MRILVVEDDQLAAQALTEILSSQNYAVEVASDGIAGWEMVEAYDYDLILLDVMLPRMDGISLCRELRSHGYTMPVLLLTGRDSGHDKAIGLDAGADDYVVKPFDAEELVARVRALLRRSGMASMPVLEWGKLRFDPTSCEVTCNGKPLSLTPKEYALLELFLRNSRRVFSCGMILEHLWSYDETPGEEAVRTHIKGLRQKLKAAGLPPDAIETVYGIGYRLKPLEPTPASPEIAKTTTSEPAEPLKQQAIALLMKTWNRFKGRVSEQVSVIEQAVLALQSHALTAELRQQARQEAHTLAGSLGTFGFPEGSRLARQIEQLIQGEKLLGEKECRSLQQWVMALRHEIERPPHGQHLLPESEDESRPLLLVVDPDRVLAEQIVAEAQKNGLRGAIALSLSAARRQFHSDRPDVVLLDLEIAEHLEDGLALLADLNRHTPPTPILVYSAQADVNDRLAIAQQGRHTFLQKPLPPDQILEIVLRVLQRIDKAASRVMIVDDDVGTLSTLQTLLRPWGLHVTTLADPRHFLETLEACSPDLLILDVEMPHISGIELCRVVRNDSRWGGLPILFLTAHTEPEVVNQVFTAGADDFISKPIVGPELVTRIMNRLERLKLLRDRAEVDPLTKVANRQKSTQDLDHFLQRARKHGDPLCLAVLDLDALKQINGQYGHAMGDAVLRYLGGLLRQSFYGEDVVARWAGGEFVVGMYGVNQKGAVQRLLKVLDTLKHHAFVPTEPTGNNTPAIDPVPDAQPPLRRVSFSAGVAEFPSHGEDLRSLYRAADEALQQAKQTGRSRIMLAPLPAADQEVAHG